MMTTSPDTDSENRKSALDLRQSFIVQAPAGSGKTELLIQRYLTLLSHVQSPEEILAITFTKKAANEMRLRICKALNDAALDTPILSEHHQTTRNIAKRALKQDKELTWSLLANPNRMRIQTIDALCSSLTRQLPLLSQMGAAASISDTPDLIYIDTVNEVLTFLETDNPWSSALTTLLIHLDNDVQRLHELLINLLKKRDQWLNYIHLDFKSEHIRTVLESELLQVVAEFAEDAAQLMPMTALNEIDDLLDYAFANLKLDPVFATEETSTEYVNYWKAIANLLLTKEGEWRKQFNVKNGFPAASEFKHPEEKSRADEYKQRGKRLIETLQDHTELCDALHEVSRLPPTEYDNNQWQVLSALFDVLKLCAAQLRVFFQQKGQIDFIENTQGALLALGDDEHPTDLALALDYQIKHILLDEFQDTSFTQFKLLERLILGWQANDGRTLFIVGDPMQSIYRFREAEVGLFLRLFNHGLNQIQLTPLALRKNFRATNHIVTWCNQHFACMFPSMHQITTGAVSYTTSIATKDDVNIDTHVNITELTNGNEDEQAKSIAQLILHLRNKHPTDKIAILVRARTHLAGIIPTLNAMNIPYQAVDIDPLASKPYIQDILSLTTALLHPEDRVAWLSILRAPWCGLTLTDLLIIGGENSKTTIYARINATEILNQLSSDGATRLRRILPILQMSTQARLRQPLRSWIENTWRQLGGPACLTQHTHIEDVKRLFNLYDQLNTASEPFNLDKLAAKMVSLFAKPDTNDNAVQLMTVHSAKGLEFDTVILPHLEKQPANDQTQLMHWMEYPLKSNKHALILAPIHALSEDKDPIYQFISRQQKKRADNEINRLLYVAATRAKKQLHLFYSVKQMADYDNKISASSFLSKFETAFVRNNTSIKKIDATSELSTSEQQIHKNLIRLESNWTNPLPTVSTPTASVKQRRGFILPDYSRKHIGTATHRLLQMLTDNGIDTWLQKSPAQQNLLIKYHLQQLNYSASDINEGVDTIQKIIANVLADKRGLWILQTHQVARSEYAISIPTEDGVEKYVIDRTFIDEQGTRWIIDYKTTTFNQEDLDALLKKQQYQDKMNCYAKAMRALKPHENEIKIGLYFPSLPTWHEWKF